MFVAAGVPNNEHGESMRAVIRRMGKEMPTRCEVGG